MTLKKNLYKSQFNNNREKNNYFIEYKNMDNEDNYSEYKSNKSNNNKSRHSDTEEKIIYNNEDDYSDEDDNIYKAGIKNKNKLFNSIDNNQLKVSYHIKNNKNINDDNINNLKPLDNKNYINNREENSDKILKKKNIKEKKEKGNKILTKKKDKIIECHKEKIKELIDNKDNQNIEMELKKEKLENELLKMPDTPRKLNDIKNKKEINDYINKIERDINYINSLLKNTDAH